MDDLDSLLQDLQKPSGGDTHDSNTVHLNELDDLMAGLTDDKPAASAQPDAQLELDDLLNDLAMGPSSNAPPREAAASNELDDLLNDLDAPAPKPKAAPAPKPTPAPVAAAPAPKQETFTAPAPRNDPAPAGGGFDDLDDLLDGLDAPAGGAGAAPVRSGGGNDADDLFGDINSSARSAGGGASQVRAPVAQNDTSGPSRGMCAGCNQAVHGEVLQAMGKLWHPNCFACGNCQNPLGSASFFEYEGQPHCEKCYKGLFCPRCAKCDKSITDRIITALGKRWHPECFSCATCNQPFPGGSFFERDGFPYCSEHFYNNSAQICGSCNKPVTGECTNAMNKAWHPDCFVCQYCRKAFTDGSFFESGGLPYCKLHYHAQTGSVCKGCQKAITGRSVQAMGASWHPEHFVCGFCVNPLSGGNYTEKQGKPYCAECHENLFG